MSTEPIERSPVLPTTVLVMGGVDTGTADFIAAAGDGAPLLMTRSRTREAGIPASTRPFPAFDYSTLMLAPGFAVRLIGMPNDPDYLELFDDLVAAAGAAIVLVDPEVLEDGYGFFTYLQRRGIPHVVVMESDRGVWRPADLRSALGLEDDHELRWIDPASIDDARDVVIAALDAAVVGLAERALAS